jgi:hypothetical protein
MFCFVLCPSAAAAAAVLSCRDELLTELASLESSSGSNGKDRRGQGGGRRQQRQRGTNGNDSGGDYETDGDEAQQPQPQSATAALGLDGGVNASMLSEDLRLLAALN